MLTSSGSNLACCNGLTTVALAAVKNGPATDVAVNVDASELVVVDNTFGSFPAEFPGTNFGCVGWPRLGISAVGREECMAGPGDMASPMTGARESPGLYIPCRFFRCFVLSPEKNIHKIMHFT